MPDCADHGGRWTRPRAWTCMRVWPEGGRPQRAVQPRPRPAWARRPAPAVSATPDRRGGPHPRREAACHQDADQERRGRPVRHHHGTRRHRHGERRHQRPGAVPRL